MLPNHLTELAIQCDRLASRWVHENRFGKLLEKRLAGFFSQLEKFGLEEQLGGRHWCASDRGGDAPKLRSYFMRQCKLPECTVPVEVRAELEVAYSQQQLGRVTFKFTLSDHLDKPVAATPGVLVGSAFEQTVSLAPSIPAAEQSLEMFEAYVQEALKHFAGSTIDEVFDAALDYLDLKVCP
jgi:hypothetical protein